MVTCVQDKQCECPDAALENPAAILISRTYTRRSQHGFCRACTDYWKTKDKSDENAIYVALSEFVKVGQVPHNNSVITKSSFKPEQDIESLPTPNL